MVSLVAGTAPVAFGAMGTPDVTPAQVTNLPLDTTASVVGRRRNCSHSSCRSCSSAW